MLRMIGVRAGISAQGLQHAPRKAVAGHASSPLRYSDSTLETCTRRFDALPFDTSFKYPADIASEQGSNATRASYYSPEIRTQFEKEILRSRITPQVEPESSISYYPDEAAYLKRRQRRLRNELLETEVPAGWPRAVEGSSVRPDVWSSDDDGFVHYLTPAEIREIDSALETFRAQDLPIQAVNRSTFPLPKLGPILEKIQDTIQNGFGFSIIRGLDLRKYDSKDRAVAFLGITSFISEHRGAQDRRGTMMSLSNDFISVEAQLTIIKEHIMDDERTESQRNLPFHTDVTCDFVALMTVECSDHGGKSTIAPAWKVYNDLAAARPDIIHTLARPNWPFDTFLRDPAYYYRAPLYFHAGKILFNFSRRLLVGSPQAGRSPGVPKLSDVQAEAIDAVHFTARKHQLTIPMQEGDIRFINNRAFLHGREWFHDSNKAHESRRHILRLWLRNTESHWSLPPALRLVWARIFDDPHRLVQWHVDPTIDEHGMVQGRGHRQECD